MPDAPVTHAEWERHRKTSRQTLPDTLKGQSLPDVLLPYQQRAVAAIMELPVVVIEKSRRIGLTWGIAAASVLLSASSRSAGGMDTLYLGYSLDMAREFIDTAAMWAKAFAQAACEVEECLFKDTKPDGSSDDILAYRIVFASGYEIMALTSRPRSLRGRQGMVILDEAAFHDQLGEVMKAALALLVWGGKVVVVSTHDGDTNPFNLLCEEIRKGNKPYGLIKITFDDALADGLYRRICLVQGKEWSPEAENEWREDIIAFYGEDADEELFVIPRHGSGAYIPAALIERPARRRAGLAFRANRRMGGACGASSRSRGPRLVRNGTFPRARRDSGGVRHLRGGGLRTQGRSHITLDSATAAGHELPVRAAP